MVIINQSNFNRALQAMGFLKCGDVYEKRFDAFNCVFQVDFAAKSLVYPEAVRGRERNNSFDAPENFVVFECVHRLLEKGYRPEDIELEKEWRLGHEEKSGRADICVSDKDGSMLMIIECKTAGKEFDKACRDTLADGGQLFSYWQQERSTKWLVLYTSGLNDGALEYRAPAINCSDDRNISQQPERNRDIKLYETASTALEKYEAWSETYGHQKHDNLTYSPRLKPGDSAINDTACRSRSYCVSRRGRCPDP